MPGIFVRETDSGGKEKGALQFWQQRREPAFQFTANSLNVCPVSGQIYQQEHFMFVDSKLCFK